MAWAVCPPRSLVTIVTLRAQRGFLWTLFAFLSAIRKSPGCSALRNRSRLISCRDVGMYLAYGVTTDLDPSMWSQNIFPTAELIEAGEIIGPRTFSTGDPLTRGDGPRSNELSNLVEAQHAVRKMVEWGATEIKQYAQPRRDQR